MKVLIVAHGGLSTGLKKTVEMVYGSIDKDVHFIDFLGNDTSETLCKKFHEIVGDSTTLFLTDVLGGTPFLAGALHKHTYGNTEVISGVNLPMIVSVLEEKDEMKLNELANYALEEGKDGIELYNIEFKIEEDEEDGI